MQTVLLVLYITILLLMYRLSALVAFDSVRNRQRSNFCFECWINLCFWSSKTKFLVKETVGQNGSRWYFKGSENDKVRQSSKQHAMRHMLIGFWQKFHAGYHSTEMSFPSHLSLQLKVYTAKGVHLLSILQP